MTRSTATLILSALVLACLWACEDEPAAPEPATTTAPPVEPATEAPEPEPVADPNEACAQVIVVSWAGAAHAADAIDRDQGAARQKAEELRARLERGEDFATLARAESDAASTGPRGGLMGTYARDEWPAPHMAIRDALFGLSVGQVSEVVEAPYGWVVMRRCPVEKIHTRHILIRFEGATNAPEDITRSQEEALSLAGTLRVSLSRPDAHFAAIATQHSEDGSAQRGGDMGELGRGRLAPEYEAAAWDLAPGAISDPVETEFGYHVIQRLE
jgi:peptidyl-prolyl cis-trans isomerase SurA